PKSGWLAGPRRTAVAAAASWWVTVEPRRRSGEHLTHRICRLRGVVWPPSEAPRPLDSRARRRCPPERHRRVLLLRSPTECLHQPRFAALATPVHGWTQPHGSDKLWYPNLRGW